MDHFLFVYYDLKFYHLNVIVVDIYYGRPLSVSGRPCYVLPMFFLFFYGRLILRPWLTEVRESFTRGGP